MGVVGGEGGFTFVNRFNFLKLVFFVLFCFFETKNFFEKFPVGKTTSRHALEDKASPQIKRPGLAP